MTQGWVVAKDGVSAFLDGKLATLGLNAKEAADFKDFWLPHLTASPYARISFVPQQAWSVAAPLAVSPKADTTVRLFMDWRPLNAPIAIAPQQLGPTPARTGFTVVEWGGTLYK
jgi:hypothetical protein